MNRPIIGITTGDPKGIGPEIVAKALSDSEIQAKASFEVYGSKIPNPALSDAKAAELALASLEQATQDALRGEIHALVTAPVNKARLRLVDPKFVGHTEFLQQRCGTDVCMMFVARGWRVSLVTRHLPLREVASALNAVDILKTIRMTHEALIDHFGVAQPQLAVAALNPHAGEEKLFGDEESKIIQPAIRQARSEGILIEGPLSPDTLFWQMTQGRFDAVVAMYHDQGLIPIKTLAFKEAVQVTLGLPFVRVSVDHGTAEELVGKGKADPTNMKAAIHLACQLV